MLCAACAARLPENNPCCSTCALPVLSGDLCARCIRENKPCINYSFCVFRYDYPVDRLIRDLKFNSRLELSGFFGKLIAKRVVEKNSSLPDCIIPVPLHYTRLRQRGYNQALEIARHVSRILVLPLNINGIQRSRKTTPQTELIAKLRKQNIRGAFRTCANSLASLKHVVILDDVITTGATVKEMARVLKLAGIARVDVWACARAII